LDSSCWRTVARPNHYRNQTRQQTLTTIQRDPAAETVAAAEKAGLGLPHQNLMSMETLAIMAAASLVRNRRGRVVEGDAGHRRPATRRRNLRDWVRLSFVRLLNAAACWNRVPDADRLSAVRRRRCCKRLCTKIMADNPATRKITSWVRKIPRGRVATYGQIAALADRPRNSRQVGSVLKSLPADSHVPWHRVVNSQGRISDRNNSTSEGLQRCLLESEGVELNDGGRIDLNAFQWKPRQR